VKGYQIIEAGTDEEGAQLARERQPALVLMDIQRTGINGIEALGQLRADPSSFDGFQGEPISVRELLETICGVLAATG
jgi:CheY-like chemotaxis protein